MNQGKLEVVKQEMTRVNIDILGISELKWTGVGEFTPPVTREPGRAPPRHAHGDLTMSLIQHQRDLSKTQIWDFPGGPVARTPCSQCREPRFNP